LFRTKAVAARCPYAIAVKPDEGIETPMILIALGANLPSTAGPPAATLSGALGRLKQCGITIVSVSSFYQTPAWPDPAEPPYVNAVASIATRLQPSELLMLLHDVEAGFGRERGSANASRTLDLDLLDYDGRIMASDVVLPHPRMAERSFVLAPLAEIAPEWRHPVTGEGVVELLRKLMERQALRRVDAGTLEPERVERLGRAFERLERQMSELKQQFDPECRFTSDWYTHHAAMFGQLEHVAEAVRR